MREAQANTESGQDLWCKKKKKQQIKKQKKS